MTGWLGIAWIVVAVAVGWYIGHERGVAAERRSWMVRAQAQRLAWQRWRKEE
tara:strand:- start:7484 stop:7639 length:156 start_codon:yes stop_codon:yes gene_type:complete